MHFSDREAKKCQCDRNLGNYTCENIACLAEPPPLYRARQSKKRFNLGFHAQTMRLQHVQAQGHPTSDLYHKPHL